MATQQEILAWLAANPQATDRDIAAAMNQYGVSTSDLSGATGWDQNAVNDRYGVANAQNYIDTQWSGDGSVPGWGSAFTPEGTFDASNTQRNYGVLGALDGMGLTRDQQARVTGLDAGAIDSFAQQYAPQVDIYKSIYQSDLANPAPYMQPIQPTTTGLPNLSAPPALNAPVPTAQTAPSATPPANSSFGPSPGPGWTMTGEGWQPDSMGGGGGGWSGDQGMFGQQFGGYQASPWLSATADEIGRRTQQGLGQAFNQIRSNSIRNGTLGGSRQGVAEGIATRGAMDSLQGNLANLYGQDWTNAQNRYLTGRGQDITNYNTNRGMDLQQLGLGAQIYNMGVNGNWTPLQNANGIYGNYTGFGSSANSGQQGGGWQGLLGGAMGAGQYARNMGWW